MSTEGPQRQLDQRSSPATWGELVAAVFAIPGTVEGHSQVSPSSSRAVFVRGMTVEIDPRRSLAPGQRPEPVHLHGVDDTSIHLVLPADAGGRLVEAGWAVPHAYGDFGTEFLLFGPRDAAEFAVVLDAIRWSLRFATGEAVASDASDDEADADHRTDDAAEGAGDPTA